MKELPSPFSGGCACGAIRYESTADPIVMLNCHCADCQRSSGSFFSSFVVVPGEAFRFTKGSPRVHAVPSEAGGMNRRGFCAECGTPIVSNPDAAPQITAIRAGSLDDPSCFRQQIDVWTTDAHPSDFMNPDLPKFEKYPPA